MGRGEECLPDVPPAGLEEMHRRERPGKSGDMLQAAVLRKSDNTLGEICGIAGRPASSIHGWLRRLKRERLGRRRDQKSPVRRRSLTPKQEGAIKGDLGKPPSESGFERGGRNSKLLARRIQDRFDTICSRRTALRVAGRLGFSARKSGPVPCNGATAEEQAQFVREKEGHHRQAGGRRPRHTAHTWHHATGFGGVAQGPSAARREGHSLHQSS